MSDFTRTNLQEWIKSGEISLYPLTFPQRELWENSSVSPEDPANHIRSFLEIRGPITPQECEQAIQRVVDRQSAMRTSFLPGKTQALQFVCRSAKVNFQFREIAPSELEKAMEQIFGEAFDLMRGPLYRIVMLQRAPRDYVIVFTIHHAIADGWTLGVFVKDLVAAYVQRGQDIPLRPLPLGYAGWGEEERAAWPEERLESAAKFWHSRLRGAQVPWEPTANQELARFADFTDAQLAVAIRELAKKLEITLFNALLTLFHLALAEWLNLDDLVVGTPIANRGNPRGKETMGYFAGNLPLRNRLDATLPVQENMLKVHHTSIEVFANQMPFCELARRVNPAHAGGNCIYDIRFALQNHPIPEVNLPNLSVKLTMRSTGTARFDLGCEVTEMNGGLEIVWLFNTNRFTHEQTLDLNRRFHAQMSSCVGIPAVS